MVIHADLGEPTETKCRQASAIRNLTARYSCLKQMPGLPGHLPFTILLTDQLLKD